MFGRLNRKFAGIFRFLPLALLLCSTSPALAANSTDLISDPPSFGNSQTIVLAGGCFWGMQAVFQHMKGVKQAISGYAGGEADTAHYDIVRTGTTGHAESVQVTYDPSQTSLFQVLTVYFLVAHDPTELNRQGPDRGAQYRSAVFTTGEQQQKMVEDFIARLEKDKIYSAPIVTTVEPLKGFYAAEDYHQNYYQLHPNKPYIIINDRPKVAALKEKYPELYVEP